MPAAFNKVSLAWLDEIDGMTLTPAEDWIIDPVFDDPTRAFEVGPQFWVHNGGNDVHVMTDAEININPTTLAQAKETKKEQVNNYRLQLLYSSFTDPDTSITWTTGPSDIANLNAVCTLIAAGAVTQDQVWRDANNVNHTLTPTELVMLAGKIAERGKFIFFVSWQHKEAIDALTEVSAVEAYDITTGWPA